MTAEVDFVRVDMTDVSKSFGASRRKAIKAVDQASVAVEAGGTALGIVGESGSGKSTLARLMVGLMAPSTGTVSFNGNDLAQVLPSRTGRLEFRRKVQFVGQDTTSSFDPRRTLRDAVRLPAMVLNGLSRKDVDERVDEMTRLMGLPPEYADRRPHQVSGGQRQRFAIARGLIVDPKILVCDEVVSALDVSVQGSILNLLKRYCRAHGAGLVFVSHGLPATAFISDDLIVMYQGKIVDRGSTTAIISGDDVHPYTASLLAAHRGVSVGAA